MKFPKWRTLQTSQEFLIYTIEIFTSTRRRYGGFVSDDLYRVGSKSFYFYSISSWKIDRFILRINPFDRTSRIYFSIPNERVPFKLLARVRKDPIYSSMFLEKRTKRGKNRFTETSRQALTILCLVNELNELNEPQAELFPPLAFVSSHKFDRKKELMRIEGREGSRRQDKALEVAVSTFCSALLSPSPPASWPLTSARKSSRRTHLDLLAAAQTSAMKYLARLTLIFRRVTETTWKRSMHARGKPRTSRHYIPP